MSHVVAGKLRKAPFIKDGCGQDGQSKMYAIELAEMTKDWQTQEKSYTNYKALFFAKTDAAKQFYDHAFAEGAFVVVYCEKIKVESREHEGKTYISLQMDNPRLESCMPVEHAPQQQNYQPAPQQQQAPQQMAPAYQQPAPTQQPRTTPLQGQPSAPPVPQNPATGAPTKYNEPSMDFDGDIPF